MTASRTPKVHFQDVTSRFSWMHNPAGACGQGNPPGGPRKRAKVTKVRTKVTCGQCLRLLARLDRVYGP